MLVAAGRLAQHLRQGRRMVGAKAMKALLLLFAFVILVAAAFHPAETGRLIGTFSGSVAAAFNEAAHPQEESKP